MTIFVYYSDDYEDNGGVGFCEFAGKSEAESFIRDRLAMEGCREKTISDYQVIEGRRLSLEATTLVKTVRIK